MYLNIGKMPSGFPIIFVPISIKVSVHPGKMRENENRIAEH
jgi:hypothetical protein